MKEEVLDPKDERRSEEAKKEDKEQKKNLLLEDDLAGEEEEQGKKKKNRARFNWRRGRRRRTNIEKEHGGTRVLKTRVPHGFFFPHQMPPFATRVLKT